MQSPFKLLGLSIMATLPLVAGAWAGPLASVSVSSTGADGAGCGAASSACRTLQYALSNVVAPNGTVYLLDAGDFGPASIVAPVSVVGGAGAVSAPSAVVAGVTVRAGARDLVVLEKVTIRGNAEARSAHTVKMKSVTIIGTVTAQAASPMTLILENADVLGSLALDGSGETPLTVEISRATVQGGESGLSVGALGGVTKVSISDSFVAGNTTGISVAPSGKVAVENCRIVDNVSGVANAGTVGLSNSTIAGNSTGVSTQGQGATFTFGNNVIAGNSVDIQGSALTKRAFK